VITIAAQPAEKSTFEQLGVETVGLRSPMLARHRHTRGVNDVGLNAARVSFPKTPGQIRAMRQDRVVAIGQATYAFAPATFGFIRELTPRWGSTSAGAAPWMFIAAALIQASALVVFLVGRRHKKR
jgi:hypothetical protein